MVPSGRRASRVLQQEKPLVVAEQLEMLPRSRIVLIDELIDPLLYLIEERCPCCGDRSVAVVYSVFRVVHDRSEVPCWRSPALPTLAFRI